MKQAKRKNPKLWEKVKKEVLASDKGGKPGEWSARKAQLAVAKYKKAGGSYIGTKTKDNALAKWTKEDWQYIGEEKKSRYLPKKAAGSLTRGEKAATSRAKNKATKAGKQFSKQPRKIAKKTARYRK
ncbi:MAG: hypothetical protein P0S96_00945 [Simkaniaceae bacterium]|nr:hypothetical protein [Candidatus Sacchlamyda saccharinae]